MGDQNFVSQRSVWGRLEWSEQIISVGCASFLEAARVQPTCRGGPAVIGVARQHHHTIVN